MEGQALKTEVDECAQVLKARFGAVIHGEALWRLLGFGTERNYQYALKRGEFNGKIALRAIPGRKGRYAQPAALANWIVIIEKVNWQERITEALTRGATKEARRKKRRSAIE
jgi:hypothetical protein